MLTCICMNEWIVLLDFVVVWTFTFPSTFFWPNPLERFYLPFNNITGTIPSEIGDLSHLGMYRCGWTGEEAGRLAAYWGWWWWFIQLFSFLIIYPFFASCFDCVVRLQLTANQIEGTIPLEIAQLSTLVVLGLGRNQLSGSLPSALGGLKNLSKYHVRLIDVRLRIIRSPFSQNMFPLVITPISLRVATLGLEGNSFEGTLPTEFGQMVSLGKLCYWRRARITSSSPLLVHNTEWTDPSFFRPQNSWR